MVPTRGCKAAAIPPRRTVTPAGRRWLRARRARTVRTVQIPALSRPTRPYWRRSMRRTLPAIGLMASLLVGLQRRRSAAAPRRAHPPPAWNRGASSPGRERRREPQRGGQLRSPARVSGDLSSRAGARVPSRPRSSRRSWTSSRPSTRTSR